MSAARVEALDAGYDGLEVLQWPELPEGVRDLAQQLTELIDAHRRLAGVPASVREEESLHDAVTSLVDRVIEAPSRHGVPPLVQERLRTDEAFRRAVEQHYSYDAWQPAFLRALSHAPTVRSEAGDR